MAEFNKHTQWQTYLITPKAPLVFRTARPFGASSSKTDITFPLPSSAAGLMRAQLIENDVFKLTDIDASQKQLNLSDADKQQIEAIAVKGVFLVKKANNKITFLVPKPDNAVYMDAGQQGTQRKINMIRCLPKPYEAGCFSDLPDRLLPVMMTEEQKGKPVTGAEFWVWEDFCAWQKGQALEFEEVNQRGVKTLCYETRLHAGINDETLAADDGLLFTTIGFDFGRSLASQQETEHNSDLALVCSMAGDDASNISDGLVRFGGEGRLSWLQKTAQVLPDCDDDLPQQIAQQGGFCLTLLTPALFSTGVLPGFIDKETMEGYLPHTSIKVRLVAMCNKRWQAVSGWDLQRHKPKAMRKAVPAGAMYWFTLLEQGDKFNEEMKQLWLSPISDNLQDQRDGFGVAVLHPWQSVI